MLSHINGQTNYIGHYIFIYIPIFIHKHIDIYINTFAIC